MIHEEENLDFDATFEDFAFIVREKLPFMADLFEDVDHKRDPFSKPQQQLLRALIPELKEITDRMTAVVEGIIDDRDSEKSREQ